MSGHSKWSTIKRKKAAQDKARGKLFSRLSREIMAAAREGGGDPDANARLRTAIDNAKAENMPKDNIARAIKRGTGEIPGAVIEDATYEGYGPSGVALLVQCTTDNKNRTVSEIRKLLERHGGSMGEANSVAWMFRQVGQILVDASAVDEERLLEIVLEAGAEDVGVDDGLYEIVTAPADFQAVRDALAEHDIPLENAELAMIPNNYVPVAGADAERCLALMEALDDHDDVQNVWANVDVQSDHEPAARAG